MRSPYGWIDLLRCPDCREQFAFTATGSEGRGAARYGILQCRCGFAKDVARGLNIRCDWGPQYIADAWINEVRWLGITISPSYVREPECECNGVIERFKRTLKEQCVYLHRFESLKQARAIIGTVIARYNQEWLIERLGHRTPAQARVDALGRPHDRRSVSDDFAYLAQEP